MPKTEIELDRKLKLFSGIFRALAGENRDDVSKETLILELVNTGKYTEQEALVYIKQLSNMVSYSKEKLVCMQ